MRSLKDKLTPYKIKTLPIKEIEQYAQDMLIVSVSREEFLGICYRRDLQYDGYVCYFKGHCLSRKEFHTKAIEEYGEQAVMCAMLSGAG